MSTRTFIQIFLLALCVSFAGCGHPQPPGSQCFSDSTGLSLPPGADCVAAKTITVALVGLDTYYLKFQATSDMTPFLSAHFHAVEWRMVDDDLTPPPDWMKDLPFWSLSEIQKQSHYAGDFTNKTGTRFKTAVSYNTNNLVFYFVGMQCRD
jgi:hypothetical protein